MTYDAFISYRRDGGASPARLVKSELTYRNYKVFLDVADLEKGHFDEKLLTTISETPNFILVLAPGSLDKCVHESDWLRRELQHAIVTNRNIVPVCLPGFVFPPSLPAEIADLSRHQAVEYSHTLFNATMEKILKAIGKPRASSVLGRTRLTTAGALSVAVLAAAALLYGVLIRVPNQSPPVEPPSAAKFTAIVIPMLSSDKAVITGLGQPSPLPSEPSSQTGTPTASRAPDPTLYTVEYHYGRTADGFTVNYQLPYLDLLRAGGPITGIRYETSPFFAPFPKLRATIANNGIRS